MPADLNQKIKRGLSWAFLSQVITQGMVVISTILLARMLGPNVFGLVSMVIVFSGFANFFVDMGFAAALIQKKSVDDALLTTAFWSNMFMGSLIYLIFFIAAPYMALFYKEPQITLLTRVVASTFIILSFTIVQSSLIDRSMNFKKKAIVQWVSLGTGYLTGLTLAYYDFGVWSIVAQLLTTATVQSGILWITSSWYPNFSFSWTSFRSLSSFGWNVMGDSTVNYWSRNADNFLIGKFLGSEALGFYSRAYTLMLLPVRNVSSVISKVMFPAFSSIQDNVKSISEIYLKTIKYIAAVTFPAMTGLTLLATEFVLVFFGEAWAPMIPILRWLSMLGAFQSILSLNGTIYNSLGRAHIAFRVSLVVSTVLLISFVTGIWINGLMGITMAYFIAGTVLMIPIYYVAIRQINITFRQVIVALRAPIVASGIMALVLYVLKLFLPSWIDNLAVFLISLPLGAGVYVLILINMDSAFKSFFANLSRKRN